MDDQKPTTQKIENLELNTETIVDLQEETLQDLIGDQAEGVRGGMLDGGFNLGKNSGVVSCKGCPTISKGCL